MKILMIARSTLYSSPGGDTVQIEMTAKYLRYLGLEIDIVLADNKVDYNKYDLIHFFNIIRPDDIFPHLNNNLPFVVSTVFVDFSEYEKKARSGISGFVFKLLSQGQIEYIKVIARYLIKGDKIKSKEFILKGQTKSIKNIVKRSKLLLPNSHSEYNRLEKLVKFSHPYHKIVNAIDYSIFNLNLPENEAYKDHVLCVGRIEGRKNQLNLIKAMIDTDIPLTLIGKPALNQMSYYQECKRIAAQSSNIKFIEHIDHSELVSIYRAAKVHVLPSWFETTGLSSLEAAAMGCNIVISKKGDTEEYFGDMAFYCEPEDIASIKKAILNAYSKPKNNTLKSFVLENYTWDKTALQTRNAYQHVLATTN